MTAAPPKYRIGVDVGGTNTDAVIMAGRTVLAGVKAPTTKDVMTGVLEALVGVLDKAGVARAAISAVIIGTTHFTNAIIERRHLAPTAIVRLGLPATRSLPPMVDWPDELHEAIGLHAALAHGGNEFDGRAISALDENELRGIGREIAAKGIRAIAISSVFSPVDEAMEARAAKVLESACPGARVVLSSHIGRLGLLERENAAILNASLLDLAERTVDAFARALQGCGLTCRFFISQNDGTLMDGEQVKRYPVLTFGSGPTNSMRGAAFLSGHGDAIVIDVGGTTADVGLLQHGFPREASTTVDIGGVRTNFRMPDVFSFGLGGGSIVEKCGNDISVGPRSVGYEITQKALCFGGNVLTATDVAVGLGLAKVGDPAKVARLDAGFLRAVKQVIDGMVERAVERSRVSSARIPVVAVGGGSILVQDRIGDLDVLRPENFAVANAVGAAIAQVSGEVDRVFSLTGGLTRAQALGEAESIARDKALAAGAVADSIVAVEREDVPLAYLPGNATRIRVKVVGDIEI